MTDEFTGTDTPLTDADFERAAKKIGCSVAAVRAVAKVESNGGGYLADGRPKILFERHVFHKRTNGVYDAGHSGISNSQPRGYSGGAAEYDRLAEAIALDRKAALESASWGAFQVMGFNCKAAGYADVEAFVKDMVHSPATQLDAFVGFILKNHLDDELRNLNWKGFASGYNGSGYAENHYDEKMAAAYLLYSKGGARSENPNPVLRIGDKGDAVKQLQTLLGLNADGDFGAGTKAAVVKLQKAKGLYADGVVGGQTWAAAMAARVGAGAAIPMNVVG
ncbi:MAG: hypothetical protein RLY97_2101 [Pseudomonadota bacterium]